MMLKSHNMEQVRKILDDADRADIYQLEQRTSFKLVDF